MDSFTVPQKRQVRVILNTDAKNEADDQYAIVHSLLTPKFRMKGLIAAHYGRSGSMGQSYAECEKLLELMHMGGSVPIFKGAEAAVTKDGRYEYSEGARRIVEEALSDDTTPLFVAFQGPITDLACAYLEHPEIAGRLTAIWIGGGRYPEGGREANLSNDIEAANIIFKSGIDLWQVPVNVYSKMLVSLTELEEKVAPCGNIGEYLFLQMIQFNDNHTDWSFWPTG